MTKIDKITKLGKEIREAESDQILLAAEVVLDSVQTGKSDQLLQLIGTIAQNRATALDLMVAISDRLQK